MCDAIGLSHNWPCRRYELSGVAAALASSQRQCRRSLVVHEVYDTGLGADLSVWASALCEAANAIHLLLFCRGAAFGARPDLADVLLVTLFRFKEHDTAIRLTAQALHAFTRQGVT